MNAPRASASWADIALVAHIWVLAVSVRLLKHIVPLPALVRLAGRTLWVRSRTGRVKRICRLAAAGRLPGARLPGNCLDRSLALFRLLVTAGASPTLVVGVRPTGLTPFAGHVWLRMEAEELGESSNAHGAFGQVLSFDARGRVEVSLMHPPAAGS